MKTVVDVTLCYIGTMPAAIILVLTDEERAEAEMGRKGASMAPKAPRRVVYVDVGRRRVGGETALTAPVDPAAFRFAVFLVIRARDVVEEPAILRPRPDDRRRRPGDRRLVRRRLPERIQPELEWEKEKV